MRGSSIMRLRRLPPPSVLLLADNDQSHAATILDHIAALTRLSTADVRVYNPRGVSSSRMLDLSEFDVVIIHYSLFILSDGYLAPSFREKIRAFRGLKIQFIQDDYRWVNAMCEMMRYLGIDILYTLVPPDEIQHVWSEERLPGVRKINTLAGYVPENLAHQPVPRIADRPIDIGYRGRTLPYWLGRLGQEKVWIAQGVLERAPEYGLRCDIGWRESDRVYGGSWTSFISSCRVTLGTESGSSITDFDGSLQRRVDEYLARRPHAGFEEVFEQILAPYEGNVKMNVISPRIFEAIALRTPLVLFPGAYMGVVKPHQHYIPLEKDFSNMADVARRIRDTPYLEDLGARAYDEIVATGRHSFEFFVREFDTEVTARCTAPRRRRKFRYYLARLEPNPAVVIERLFRVRDALSPLGRIATAMLLLLAHPDLPYVWGRRRLAEGKGRRIRPRALLKDLLRLGAAHRIRQSSGNGFYSFDIALVYDKSAREVVLRSVPTGTVTLADQLSEEYLRDLLGTSRVAGIRWDHSAFGKTLDFWWNRFLRIMFEMDADGVYQFEAFAAVAQASPAIGARALFSTATGRLRGGSRMSPFSVWLRELANVT